MQHHEGSYLRQLTIPEFLAYLDLDSTPTKDLDSTDAAEASISTKLELILSAYLDKILASEAPLTLEQTHVIKLLCELTR